MRPEATWLRTKRTRYAAGEVCGESAAAGEESWILNAADRTAHPRSARALGCFAHADARSSARRVTVRTKSSLNSASA